MAYGESQKEPAKVQDATKQIEELSRKSIPKPPGLNSTQNQQIDNKGQQLWNTIHANVTKVSENKFIFNEDKALQEFKKILGPGFNPAEVEKEFCEFIKRLKEVAITKGNEFIIKNDIAGRDTALSYTSATNRVLANRGYGDFNKLQQDSLVEMTKGASDQQRQDAFRAALTCGFSAASVFGAALVTKQTQAAMEMLRNEAIKSTQEQKDVLDKLEQKKESDEKAKKEYDEKMNTLGQFLGGQEKAKDVLADGKDPVIEAAVQGQIYRAMLDNGDLSIVPAKKSSGPKNAMS
jgi:hypothetical protein